MLNWIKTQIMDAFYVLVWGIFSKQPYETDALIRKYITYDADNLYDTIIDKVNELQAVTVITSYENIRKLISAGHIDHDMLTTRLWLRRRSKSGEWGTSIKIEGSHNRLNDEFIIVIREGV